MRRLIECVPNFSEGRDSELIQAIVTSMSGIRGAWLLDTHSDPDHHRSVVTLAGTPDEVVEAALRGVGKAAELIDLRRHAGAHPRIGAMDVLPFVPIEGVTMEECVVLARRAGQQIWARHAIPVYFYEKAALRPERAQLESVREGQFEYLREEVLRNPRRAPDVGEARLHPTAGAVAVGARKFLIAYNINLSSPDVSIAAEIAQAIRSSSGGLPCVKAMGIHLQARDLAQVSTNLTDFERTPIGQVFRAVRAEAARHACSIVSSEIVGLVPRKALETEDEISLQLENFSPAKILENRLEFLVNDELPESISLPGRAH
jgi:glutamate formiminotransferase